MRAALGILLVLGAWAITTYGAPAFADGSLKVLSDGPLQPALIPIGGLFWRSTGHAVEYSFGPSPVIHKRILSGEAADVVIIQPNLVTELAKVGRLSGGDHAVIGRVGFGLAARAGSPALDIGTVEKFKKVLLNSDSLVFNNVASGNYFATVLQRLGIADLIKAKVIRTTPAEVFERIKNGKSNELGAGTISQIVTDKDLRFVGPLPGPLQDFIVYAAVVTSTSSSPELAQQFVTFLGSAAARSMFEMNGIQTR